MTETSEHLTFQQLDLTPPLLKALNDLGYETPSPIQVKTIPLVAAGRDVLGQAQTGTGKTAAFALPLLANIDLKNLVPQVLVLAPTRELVIQVSEAFHKYAAHMNGFHVMPIYGGQDYQTQLKQLKRGVHVVVGTPGRVMDHMRRGTLKLDSIKCLVLDEADEMLRIGFLGDVEWILEQTPKERQIALFSATMPDAIRRITKKYLKNPEHITIKVRTTTAENIRQRYWMVSGQHKLDALTRILEAETYDGILIFVRTKTATVELAEKLGARGYAVTALNGDIAQKQRIRTIERLKKGELDIVVATDVAARGLDVQRISHVINFDIPHDTESYVHRIGRTGRAGRNGDAILFISPREKHLLSVIEKATRQKIDLMELPSVQSINDKRIARFTQQISDTLAKNDHGFFTQLLEDFQREHNVPAIEIAAALASMLQGSTPLLMKNKPESDSAFIEKPERSSKKSFGGKDREGRSSKKDFGDRSSKFGKKEFGEKSSRFAREDRPGRTFDKEGSSNKRKPPSVGMEAFRVEVGRDDGVRPANIMGAIANEAGLARESIGQIQIYDTYSTVELPRNISKEVFQHLKSVWASNKQLKISKMGDAPPQRNEYKPKSEPRRAPRGEARGNSRDDYRSDSRAAPRGAPRSASKGAPRGAASKGAPPRGIVKKRPAKFTRTSKD